MLEYGEFLYFSVVELFHTCTDCKDQNPPPQVFLSISSPSTKHRGNFLLLYPIAVSSKKCQIRVPKVEISPSLLKKWTQYHFSDFIHLGLNFLRVQNLAVCYSGIRISQWFHKYRGPASELMQTDLNRAKQPDTSWGNSSVDLIIPTAKKPIRTLSQFSLFDVINCTIKCSVIK